MEQQETILTKMVDMLREEDRPVLRQRIEAAAAEAGDGGRDVPGALRFLKDLDIYVNMRGADFIYTRGIAESLRVGEDIFELAYAMKHALR